MTDLESIVGTARGVLDWISEARPEGRSLYRVSPLLEAFCDQRRFPMAWMVHQELGILPGEIRWEGVGRTLIDRLLIPIRDAAGRLVSISSRGLIPGDTKFWHIPFERRYHLWGIEHQRPSLRIFLMESYFDVLAARRCGYQNAVAMMGSTLREEQAALLARYTEQVVYIPHRDKATPEDVRVVEGTLRVAGIETLSVTTPAKDFAEYYEELGPAAAGRFLSWLFQETQTVTTTDSSLRERFGR